MKSLSINTPYLEKYQHAPSPDWSLQQRKVIIPRNNNRIHQPTLNMKCMRIKAQYFTNRQKKITLISLYCPYIKYGVGSNNDDKITIPFIDKLLNNYREIFQY